MTDRTDVPAGSPAAGTEPTVILEQRVRRLEDQVAAIRRNLSVLMGAELDRLCADFTPEQLAAVHDAARNEADRTAMTLRGAAR